ncbi:DUF5677 domain-containing protein [Clostridioides difficile]|nr:DUF5677 domain-containing protein [Clostridioides difficile]MCZ1114800.1 DUF5677 domain-containing protein [Clostridioides difficile]MDI6395017.1 DUF5677 domain-containing protein [Clostridioides difficile]
MSHSKLSDHKLKKGKFIAPFNEFMTPLNSNESWCLGRLPEYIWIGLLINKYGRKKGMEIIYKIIVKLHSIESDIVTPRLSEILSMEDVKQDEFFSYILTIVEKEALSPLTLIFTYSNYPIFVKYFAEPSIKIEDRVTYLDETLRKAMHHQSEFATDIRFIVLYYFCMSGKLVLQKEQINNLLEYPNLEHTDEKMRMLRPFIRAAELMVLNMEKKSDWYLDIFWGRISVMTECKLYATKFEDETANTDLYMEQLHEVFVYLSDLLCKVNPLDEKMLVLFGIAIYSYKRLREVVEHKLFNSISGRGSVRVLIENYIMMKYLVKIEAQHENIWSEYQFYGIGQYKLIVARYREQEQDLKNSHVDYKYIEALVNEFVIEETIDMDTKYFDKQNIRSKAEIVGEKELYGLYYDYDSAYEHGLWGSIRESSMLKCDNPAHHYHCIPDVDNNQNLKSVWHDCVNIMEKTLLFLDSVYGIPQHLLLEVIKNGKEFFTK